MEKKFPTGSAGVNDLIKPPGEPSDPGVALLVQLVAAPPVVRQFHTFCVAMAISKVARLVKLSQKVQSQVSIHTLRTNRGVRRGCVQDTARYL